VLHLYFCLLLVLCVQGASTLSYILVPEVFCSVCSCSTLLCFYQCVALCILPTHHIPRRSFIHLLLDVCVFLSSFSRVLLCLGGSCYSNSTLLCLFPNCLWVFCCCVLTFSCPCVLLCVLFVLYLLYVQPRQSGFYPYHCILSSC